MAIDFPNSPSVGQVFTVGSRSWKWDGTVWQIYANTPNIYVQDSAPSSPQAGDQWYESDTGRWFLYYDSVWVEIGNATDIAGVIQPKQITDLSAVTSLTTDDVFVVVDNPSSATAANKITYGNLSTAISNTLAPGLVLITSGITTNSGNTVSNGVVTVGSAVSTVEINGAFSSTYDHYKIIYVGGSASADGDLGIKLGSTTTGYYMTLAYLAWGGTTWGFVTTSNGSSFGNVGSSRTTANFLNVDIFNPFASDETSISGQYVGPKTNSVLGPIGGFLNNTTSYTSFTISPNTGTLTGGQVRVYGYRN